MKTPLLTLLAAGMILISGMTAKAQVAATFEEFTLAPNSYYNGSKTPGGTTFASGQAIFPNLYDSSFGGFWGAGWAYSNMKDSTTAGFTNEYSAITGIGYNSSANYAIGQQNAIVVLGANAKGGVVNGCYITNATYPYISMRDGDTFAKKFGGDLGTDPDWFKVVVRKIKNKVPGIDSVEFYLADYRSKVDYIVNTWKWLDLTPLGNVDDSLIFTLSSSDAGDFGMNTPAFFCIDNFTTKGTGVGMAALAASNGSMSVYPNPANDLLHIQLSTKTENATLNIMDITGKTIRSEKVSTPVTVDIADLNKGIYFIQVTGNGIFLNSKFVKE